MKRILILLTISLALCSTASSFQGGGGESTKSPTSTGKPPIKTRPTVKHAVTKPSKPFSTIKGLGTKRGASPQPKSAPVTISVSEAEAEVFLTDRNGKSVFQTDSQFTNTDKARIIIDNLNAGRYKLVVRKEGYFDEHRTLAIVRGIPSNITVNLRASVGFLTLSGKLEGATIEIDGVGTFQGPLTRQSIKPGTYQLRINKKGYQPVITNIQIDLGLESVHIFVLRQIVAR